MLWRQSLGPVSADLENALREVVHHFEQGLTLREAAAALDLGDHRKAGLRLARIFDLLRERLAGPSRG